MKDFYIYMYLDPVNYDTFYIGKGSNRRYKISQHLTRHAKNNWLRNKINKIGSDKVLIKLINCKNEQESIDKEKLFIKLIGRKDQKMGTLLNLTDGGDGLTGYKWTEEQKLNKSKETIEYFKKNNGTFLGKKHTQEARKKMSKAKQGEKQWSAKLTEKDVIWIRKNINNKNILIACSKFNISRCTINDVIKNVTWKHLL